MIRIIIVNILVSFMTVEAISQLSFIDKIKCEANNRVFDTQYDFPGHWSTSNKWHRSHRGISRNIKRAIVYYPKNTKVIVEFNSKGNLVYYNHVFQGRQEAEVTYKYAEDEQSILTERGSFNLNYTRLDSNSYFAVNDSDNGTGFYRGIDTLFIYENGYDYTLVRKFKKPDKPTERYEFSYNKQGQFESVLIYNNDVKVGHTITKYNEAGQVVEQEEFWLYARFAEDLPFNDMIGNRVYEFTYNTTGLLNSITKSIYSPIERKWTPEKEEYESTFSEDEKGYSALFRKNDEEFMEIIFDEQGNWIKIEEYSYDEKKVIKRELEYYK